MTRWLWAACAATLFLWTGAANAGNTYTIKQSDAPPPSEVSDPVRKLLAERSFELHDGAGALVCQIWFRKEVPAKATPEQVKNGLTYREMEESTLIGAIRFDQQSTDYRKQKIKPGIYTLRLGFQPMDGDHMGTAPYPDFCLLVPANLDTKPALIESKELRELSAKAIGGSHPGVLLLFPNEKLDGAAELADKGNNTWVLNVALPVSVEGQKARASLGFGLTLVGQTSM
jgi:hypothetical protein